MQNWLPLNTRVMSTSPGLGLWGVLTAMAFGLRNWIQRKREGERERERGKKDREVF